MKKFEFAIKGKNGGKYWLGFNEKKNGYEFKICSEKFHNSFLNESIIIDRIKKKYIDKIEDITGVEEFLKEYVDSVKFINGDFDEIVKYSESSFMNCLKKQIEFCDYFEEEFINLDYIKNEYIQGEFVSNYMFETSEEFSKKIGHDYVGYDDEEFDIVNERLNRDNVNAIRDDTGKIVFKFNDYNRLERSLLFYFSSLDIDSNKEAIFKEVFGEGIDGLFHVYFMKGGIENHIGRILIAMIKGKEGFETKLRETIIEKLPYLNKKQEDVIFHELNERDITPIPEIEPF